MLSQNLIWMEVHACMICHSHYTDKASHLTAMLLEISAPSFNHPSTADDVVFAETHPHVADFVINKPHLPEKGRPSLHAESATAQGTFWPIPRPHQLCWDDREMRIATACKN